MTRRFKRGSGWVFATDVNEQSATFGAEQIDERNLQQLEFGLPVNVGGSTGDVGDVPFNANKAVTIARRARDGGTGSLTHPSPSGRLDLGPSAGSNQPSTTLRTTECLYLRQISGGSKSNEG